MGIYTQIRPKLIFTRFSRSAHLGNWLLGKTPPSRVFLSHLTKVAFEKRQLIKVNCINPILVSLFLVEDHILSLLFLLLNAFSTSSVKSVDQRSYGQTVIFYKSTSVLLCIAHHSVASTKQCIYVACRLAISMNFLCAFVQLCISGVTN